VANSGELAGKAAVRDIMMMKQEAMNVVFGGDASLPPSHSIGGALSTTSFTSTSSERPPLEPNTPVIAAPAWAPMAERVSRSPGLATFA
jgi:hypothetical protein